jgi:hypothetical protein
MLVAKDVVALTSKDTGGFGLVAQADIFAAAVQENNA